MICPVCRFGNFPGDDVCANCGADLWNADTPQPATSFRGRLLGMHLNDLGARGRSQETKGRPYSLSRCSASKNCLAGRAPMLTDWAGCTRLQKANVGGWASVPVRVNRT